MGLAHSATVADAVQQLPAESLVAVPLRVLARQEPVWKADALVGLIPDSISCMPLEGESPSIYSDGIVVTGYAEMYGGAGLAANAGGVRCANLGTVQIKGVGPTALAGRTTDKWHKHGACSLQDAIKEAIFSELFHVALPHGASRPVAIYDIGVTFATEIGVDKLPSSAPRALFVRQPIVRLAHFMRSAFMNVDHSIAVRELPRMRAVVPLLVDALCVGHKNPCLEAARDGLIGLYWRVLEQTISMRLSRLVHGSMIPSNFGVDGRLIDFTTATSVSTLQPVVVALGSACSQTQHLPVLDTVTDMVFYMSKFDSRCAADRPKVDRYSQDVLADLKVRYETAVMLAHLQLIGLSQFEQHSLSRRCQDRLARAITRIILQGSTEGQLYYGGDEHSMLPATGKNDLCGALLGTVLKRGDCNEFVNAAVAETCSVFTPSSVSELSYAYDQACAELANCGLASETIKLSHAVRALKANADLSGLYRRNIDGAINDLCVGGGDVSEFVDTTISRWRNVLRLSTSDDVHLSGWLTEGDYRLSAKNEFTLDDRPCDFQPVVQHARDQPLSQKYQWIASSFANY
jgi:hypothetical protein